MRLDVTEILKQARREHLVAGTVVEVGPGRAWPGLALAAREPDLDLLGVGYPAEEREQALARARVLGVQDRVAYLEAGAPPFPLPDRCADGVMSFGALHRWENPLQVLDEIARVLKPGGKAFIGDVRPSAGWWARFLAGRKPELAEIYRDYRRAPSAGEFSALAEHSALENWRLAEAGADIWLLPAETAAR